MCRCYNNAAQYTGTCAPSAVGLVALFDPKPSVLLHNHLFYVCSQWKSNVKMPQDSTNWQHFYLFLPEL